MATDRTNSRVAPIADPFQPAVLRMIRQTIEAGRGAGIDVALCGELAADSVATPLLLGLGLEEFSVSAPLIPELKRAISLWSAPEAEAVAREALAMDSSQSVRRLLLLKRPNPDLEHSLDVVLVSGLVSFFVELLGFRPVYLAGCLANAKSVPSRR